MVPPTGRIGVRLDGDPATVRLPRAERLRPACDVHAFSRERVVTRIGSAVRCIRARRFSRIALPFDGWLRIGIVAKVDAFRRDRIGLHPKKTVTSI
ncbi:hypothetical protein [Burkholderia mayonis]|uniref:hypothetical protein n=1 Tax=Burkholderia mayonis TaxID=1385591 RepID=UPI00131EEFF2|nr:hypothetical protein [Burkholderia mayonis]